MFAKAIESIFENHCTPAAVRAIESGAGIQPLASAIAEAGFYELLAPEINGGGGANWSEFHDVVGLCGAYAVPLPIAQTMASRIIVDDLSQLPPGLITYAPTLTRGMDGSFHAPNVPAAQVATHVIAVDADALVLLPVSDADQQPSGIHGNLALSLHWKSDAAQVLESRLAIDDFHALGALLHAGLLAGAMKRVFTMTMRYANDRVQFGKSIGKFQAIQHQLSVMAENVAAAGMAAEAAFGTTSSRPARPACAIAKARTSEAAQLVAAIAHAVHGAIGVTEEYDLQLYTRRLHEWRLAHGSETYWHRVLGRLFVQSREPLAVDFVRSLC